MTETKKRGRPSKADIAAREAAAAVEGADADVARVVVARPMPDVVTFVPLATSRAQAYALRVWHGQSSTADRSWRIQRVKEALEGQGLSFEGVELP